MATTYKYKAIDEHGKFVRGSIDAANMTDLELRLSNLRLDLINYRVTGKLLLRLGRRKVSRHELINFTFHLEQLLSAGVSLIDALRDLRESIEHIGFREVVAELVTSIEGGKTFSLALEEFSDIFGKVFVSMIRVGEESGQLPRILADITEMQRWQDELASQAKRAMIYPSVVAIVVFFSIICQMVFLVPELVKFIRSLNYELPIHTKALIATSDFFVSYWYVILFAPPVIVLVVKTLTRVSRSFLYAWDSLKLRVWVLGPILFKIKLARLANYFALLYASGITVLDAIALCRNLADNLVLDEVLENIHEQISEGESISGSFAQTGVFPALVVRMLKVGENSGAMDKALLNVSYFYNRQVKESVAGLEPVLGPLLIIVIALVMGWIALSVIGPIYDAMLIMGSF